MVLMLVPLLKKSRKPHEYARFVAPLGTNSSFRMSHGIPETHLTPPSCGVFCVPMLSLVGRNVASMAIGAFKATPRCRPPVDLAGGLASIQLWLRRGSHGEFACKRLMRTPRFDAVCSCLQGCCVVTRPNTINRTMRPHQPEILFPGAPKLGRAVRTSSLVAGSLRACSNAQDDPCHLRA